MSSVKVNVFSGLRPRFPESLLPEHCATVAQNCDLAYGELRNTKDGYSLYTMSNAPASIYTEDGLTFFTWDTDVDAVRSPLANDTFWRMYYAGQDGMLVADRRGMRTNGGPPATSYLVGTPRPTAAPTLTVAAPEQVTSSNATIKFKFHWEYGGVKHQEQDITPDSVSNTDYVFTPVTKDATTPETAFPVIRMTATWLRDGSQVFDLYSPNSAFESTGGLYSLSISKQTDGKYKITLTQGIKESDKETRAYVFTQVNSYGEEGPPSDPALVTTSPVLPVTVTLTKNQLTGYSPIKELRVYRTGTGTTLTDYFYVGSINVLAAASITFTDSVKAENLNEVLASLNYYPPDQALRGLMTLPNGILMAWKGNELHFSEPYKPWAWNPNNVKTLPHAVVGGIAHGSAAIVTTSAHPYMVSGVSSDAMTTSKINVSQAGVSKWSIAVLDGAVVYASNDGIVTISGATGSLAASQNFFTREVWRARYPSLSSMRFSVWDGRLIVYSNTAAFTPFMIRMDEAAGTMNDLPSFIAKCSFVSPVSDQCYYANGVGLYQFNAGVALSAEWVSRELVIPRPVNFGAAQAVCEGIWTIEFFAYVQTSPGVWAYQSKHTKIITSGGATTFRLPAGYESDRYKVRIAGAGRFRELRMAQTMRELSML